jgi:hypothetical protein
MILALIVTASTVVIVAVAAVIVVALIAPIPRCADAKRTGGPRERTLAQMAFRSPGLRRGVFDGEDSTRDRVGCYSPAAVVDPLGSAPKASTMNPTPARNSAIPMTRLKSDRAEAI